MSFNRNNNYNNAGAPASAPAGFVSVDEVQRLVQDAMTNARRNDEAASNRTDLSMSSAAARSKFYYQLKDWFGKNGIQLDDIPQFKFMMTGEVFIRIEHMTKLVDELAAPLTRDAKLTIFRQLIDRVKGETKNISDGQKKYRLEQVRFNPEADADLLGPFVQVVPEPQQLSFQARGSTHIDLTRGPTEPTTPVRASTTRPTTPVRASTTRPSISVRINADDPFENNADTIADAKIQPQRPRDVAQRPSDPVPMDVRHGNVSHDVENRMSRLEQMVADITVGMSQLLNRGKSGA